MTAPQPAPIRLDIRGPAPIAIGSDVEVRVLEEGGKGIFATNRVGTVVVELRTGVVYAPSWVYTSNIGGYSAGSFPFIPVEFRHDLVLRQHYRARVVTSRVVTLSLSGLEIVTTLFVVPETPPYR